MGEVNDNRLLHIRGVAELMRERALEQGLSEERAEDMYLLGFVHDFGYAFVDDGDGHAKAGAAVLERMGYRYAREVENHGNPAPLPEDDTRELRLLQWCDMSIDGQGRRVSLDERLSDIEERHGRDARAYIDSEKVVNRLKSLGCD